MATMRPDGSYRERTRGKGVGALTDLERRFVEEYLKFPCAVRAGRLIGVTAQHTAHKIISRRRVRDAIMKAQEEAGERAGIDAEDVRRELALLAFSDVRNFGVDDAGRLVVADGVPDEAARAVQSVKVRTVTRRRTRGEEVTVETDRTVEVRLWDKNAALGLLARHFGMLIDKDAGAGSGGGAVQVHLYLPQKQPVEGDVVEAKALPSPGGGP